MRLRSRQQFFTQFHHDSTFAEPLSLTALDIMHSADSTLSVVSEISESTKNIPKQWHESSFCGNRDIHSVLRAQSTKETFRR